MEIRFINPALLLLWLFGSYWVPPVLAQSVGPTLHIASSNGVSTVFWPLSAYEGVLQTAGDPSPTAAWTNMTSADQIFSFVPPMNSPIAYTTNVVGNEMAFNLPAIKDRQFFRMNMQRFIPVSSFAVFYNGLLEFSQCATMSVNGRVHANGPIYVGTSASLAFNGTVSSSVSLTAPMVDGLTSGWTPSAPSTWNVDFNSHPGYITNLTKLSLVGLETMTNYHFLIDIPSDNEDPTSDIGQQRLYNEAQFILLVTNAPAGSGTFSNPTVQVILQTSVDGTVPGNDPVAIFFVYTNATPGILKSNFPFLSLTNRFYDQREQKTNLVTQIDIGTYSTWVSTNSHVQGKLPAASGIYPTIMYVADRRNGLTNQLAVVRLANATKIPQNNNLGFTLATPNPLYVFGNYNVQTDNSGLLSLTTNNPAKRFPAALMSDALTILSANWTDAASYTAYNNSSSVNDASETTINAVIITGSMPSTGTSGTTFSGGIHNLPRLLEDWSATSLWLNTSLVRLWNSTMATNQFRNPQGFSPAPVNPYYNPPTRHFNYDQNLLDPSKIPPGIPVLEVMP